MRVVIDGMPIRGQSLAIVVDNLLRGWSELGADELHVVTTPAAEIRIPAGVRTHFVPAGTRHAAARLRGQLVDVPRVCRSVRADVLLGVLPTTAIGPLPCPRALIAYDVRYELRPEQYSTKARLARKYTYALGYRQADAIICISDRTRRDLFARRGWLRRRPVTVAHLGADQVDSWAGRTPDDAAPAAPYALAFGQYGNKNAGLVVDAWARLVREGASLQLTIVGLGAADRAAIDAQVARLGLGPHVRALPWLSDEQFRVHFAGASLVVFPSDFEGFGMPALESMRLGIPVVITPEAALLEVSGGHAVVMDGWDDAALAAAVQVALTRAPAAVHDARAYARDFTWRRTAEQVHDTLVSISRRDRA